MNKVVYLLSFILACALFPHTATAAGKRPADIWAYYHFNGVAFTPGPAAEGTPYIAILENVRPVILTAPASHIEPTALPDGSGVIAGICYLQSSGGKLVSGSGFKPYSRVPLLISSGGKSFVTVQTDDFGYFTAVLPAGSYTIGSGPASAEISVERGITTLIPLRAGKRMAD